MGIDDAVMRAWNFDWDYFDRRKKELAEEGIVLDCPMPRGPRPLGMGLLKGGLVVWFTEPDNTHTYWHLHINVQPWWAWERRHQHHRLAEYEKGHGMRLLRPETFEEALDTALEIIRDPAVARKHREYYLEKRLRPAVKNAERHLAEMREHLEYVEAIEIPDSILDADKDETIARMRATQ